MRRAAERLPRRASLFLLNRVSRSSLCLELPISQRYNLPTTEQGAAMRKDSASAVFVGARVGVRWAALLLLALGVAAPAAARMNVVVIMTDDQRFDTLSKMPNVLEKLAARGVTFNAAYVPTPLCSPSRATLFSGGFATRNTGVLNNNPPNGGATLFNDSENFGLVMQQAGYQTFYAGKWINNYVALGNYIPPGWNRFVGRQYDISREDWSNGIKYVNGTTGATSAPGTRFTLWGKYLTYYERDQAIEFLSRVKPGQPFFLVWSTAAPHRASTPAPGDEALFANFVYRGRGVSEVDLSDKPRWVRARRPAIDDEAIRDQLRSLQSVDRSIASIVAKLGAIGQLHNTVIVFTSDNGFHWGEHNRLWGKMLPYEESIRVPLVVVMPGVGARTEKRLVSTSLDLAPTFYQLAGVKRRTEGRSLVPLLTTADIPWRNELFFESYSINSTGDALWAAARQGKWKYIKYWTGEEELYDLASDPYELESRHADPTLASLKSDLAAKTAQRIGLAIVPVSSFPAAKVDARYVYQLKTWGGVAPYTWKLESGALPPGLTLNGSTGLISGTAKTTGSYRFSVRVTDSSFASQAERRRTFVTRTMSINAAL
jgi:N-acetylglucosamine-6-sulfatase